MADARRIGVSVDQLAFDSIAELFARHDDGRFYELERYFIRVGPLARLSDDQLIAFLRRLIFSAVNNHRYHTFREFEPGLGRISRNIRLALKADASLMLMKRHDMQRVTLRGGSGERGSLPNLPPEFLRADFFAGGFHKSTLRGMLDAIADILTEQTAYADSLPLVQVTELVHTAYAAQRPTEYDPPEDPSVSDEELRLLIDRVVKSLRADTLPGYVRKGKILPNEVPPYCAAITEILELTFMSDDGDELTYFSTFRQHMPGLDGTTYRERHRAILEYLARTAKAAMRGLLTAEFEFLRGGRPASKVYWNVSDE
jgi:hypothetical protein